MRSLYHGILADIEDTLSTADIETAVTAGNIRGSELRKMFSGIDYDDEPFSITDEAGENVFTVSVKNSIASWICSNGQKLSDHIGNIDAVKVVGGAIISADNIAEDICKKIISDTIIVRAENVEDVTFIVRPLTNGLRKIPTIQFNEQIKKVVNCNLEVDYGATAHGRLVMHNLPEFNNVSSDSIQTIEISDGNPIVFAGDKKKGVDIFGSPKWKNLFEFGYTIGSVTGANDDATAHQIKDMKAIKKLVSSKDFYSRVFGDWPYRLKRRFKMSDFLDVSKFKNLHRVVISDKRMGVIFENINHPYSKKTPAISSYFIDMLKQTWQANTKGHGKHDIVNNVPVTDDGWRVIIFRK